MAETVGNAILNGKFAAKNLAGIRKDSEKRAGHLIILRTEPEMARSILL